MSDLVWYGRLGVWAGALVLLVQAIGGRGTSSITALATISLTAGLVLFLVGLLAPSIQKARLEAPAEPGTQGVDTTPIGGPSKP